MANKNGRHTLTMAEAMYLAGVLFSFGIRIGRLPLPPANAPDEVYFHLFLWMLAELAISLTSWVGAGLALGNL